MAVASGRTMHEYFIDKRLITDTTMFGLGARPFQRLWMKPDMDITVLIKPLWRTPP